MKKTIALIALAGILAVSGCNNGSPADTTTAAQTNKTVSEVVYESEETKDTTDEALNYLKDKVPLYYNYLLLRRTTPLTFEATSKSGDRSVFSGIYIKDKENFAQYSKSSDGTEKTALYIKDTAYEINHTTKTVYTYKCGADEIEWMFNSITLSSLSLSEIAGAAYSNGVGEYEGTGYDTVNIASTYEANDGSDWSVHTDATHYFDKENGKLVYSVVITDDGEPVVTKTERFENVFDNESIFDIPTDYAQKTEQDLIAEYQAEYEAAQAAQTSSAS